MHPETIMSKLEAASALDESSRAAGEAVRRAIGTGPLKEALRGSWMGHALHPLLTDTVIGTWTSGLLLDLTGSTGGDRLVAAGILCSIPTALTGSSDWADAEAANPAARRVGAVHAVANVAALGLQVASLAARRRDARARGVALSLVAGGLLGVSGYLGGHLSYVDRVGIGVRRPATGG
jgi:uncharacterized membrane protein